MPSAPLLEGLGNISGARVPGMCAGMQEYFRDISDHLQRLNQTIESIRETVSTAISVNLSMITLQESENDEAPRRVCRTDRRADADRRYLRHELRPHARAALALRLRARARR